jgi:hypothetical protein
MTGARPAARLVASGCTAIAIVLAIGGMAHADIGIAGFSPSSARPGDSVLLGLHGSTYVAADVRIALARMSRTHELVGADEAIEVEARNAGQAGEYLIVVPELDPGRQDRR